MFDNRDNNLPPVIFIAESPEKAISYKWDSGARFLNNNLAVMDANDVRRLGEGKKHFYLPYDLTPNDVLIRHPYHQGYIPISDAEEQYLQESAEGIFLMARCLGAKEIVYKKSNIKEFIRELDCNNNLKYKVVDLNVNVKNSIEEELKHYVELSRSFPASNFTDSDFEKAKKIAEERGLLISSDIRSLIDARNPYFGKPMSHQKLSVEISSSLNKALDIAFTLNTVPFFNLSSDTRVRTQKKLVLRVEWDILF